MKIPKIIIVLIFLCVFVGCATDKPALRVGIQAVENKALKADIRATQELPVKVDIQGEKGLPIKADAEGNKWLRVEVKVPKIVQVFAAVAVLALLFIAIALLNSACKKKTL